MKTLEVLFTPADFAALKSRPLDNALCVVFDIFRATSSMITALANGAVAIIPAAEISEALAFKNSDFGIRNSESVLLAGEREGFRIRAALTGGTDFDLGNSPREFTREKVEGKTIAMTTTNGTRALRACAHAQTVLVGSFLNLRATADFILRNAPETLLLVCSGTMEHASYEDTLAAGAMCDLLWPEFSGGIIFDSALMAHEVFQAAKNDLMGAAARSRNGSRLLKQAELREDIAFCLRRDVFDFVAVMRDGKITKDEPSVSSASPRPSGERAGVRGFELEKSSSSPQPSPPLRGGEGDRFLAAIRRFDEENSRDPNVEIINGIRRPREVVYAERLTFWVLKLCPDASEPLRLAARCQHLCRWMSPRDSYPMTRAGYLQWRAELKKFHAQKSGEILREVGYAHDVVERVQALNLKKDFPRDPESCVLEDALCLVFLEHQLADLASKTEDEKVITALQKSWKKMTSAAHAEALKLSYGPREKALLDRALQG